jgi:hypothetical protein
MAMLCLVILRPPVITTACQLSTFRVAGVANRGAACPVIWQGFSSLNQFVQPFFLAVDSSFEHDVVRFLGLAIAQTTVTRHTDSARDGLFSPEQKTVRVKQPVDSAERLQKVAVRPLVGSGIAKILYSFWAPLTFLAWTPCLSISKRIAELY